MAYARRVDRNHGVIVEAFRRLCCSVADTSRLGHGFPDLVVAARGVTAVVEIKDGQKKKLTRDEQTFRDAWRGRYYVVGDVDDVLRVVTQLQLEARALCS